MTLGCVWPVPVRAFGRLPRGSGPGRCPQGWRILLLGSGTITVHEQIDAYRVPARVSPAVHLPRPAQALLDYATSVPRAPETHLTVVTEVPDAARRMDVSEPRRFELPRPRWKPADGRCRPSAGRRRPRSWARR